MNSAACSSISPTCRPGLPCSTAGCGTPRMGARIVLDSDLPPPHPVPQPDPPDYPPDLARRWAAQQSRRARYLQQGPTYTTPSLLAAESHKEPRETEPRDRSAPEKDQDRFGDSDRALGTADGAASVTFVGSSAGMRRGSLCARGAVSVHARRRGQCRGVGGSTRRRARRAGACRRGGRLRHGHHRQPGHAPRACRRPRPARTAGRLVRRRRRPLRGGIRGPGVRGSRRLGAGRLQDRRSARGHRRRRARADRGATVRRSTCTAAPWPRPA